MPVGRFRSRPVGRSIARGVTSSCFCFSIVSIQCSLVPVPARWGAVMAAPMTLADFESLYQQDEDPWGYLTRPYGRDKYRATLDACGPGLFESVLELGASIGVFSAMLAPRCRRLTTMDGAPTAVHAAEQALSGQGNVRILLGTIPDAIPASGRSCGRV